MELRYETEICAVGALASQFFDEGLVILFAEDAPAELADFAVLHRCARVHGPVEPGDVIELGGQRLRVVGVGEVVNDHLAEFGHVVVKRDGRSLPQLPGDLSCDEGPIPALAAGMRLRIVAG